MAEFLLQPATRKAVAPKIVLSGCAGSGKTLSALLLAAGMIDVRTEAAKDLGLEIYTWVFRQLQNLGKQPALPVAISIRST